MKVFGFFLNLDLFEQHGKQRLGIFKRQGLDPEIVFRKCVVSRSDWLFCRAVRLGVGLPRMLLLV